MVLVLMGVSGSGKTTVGGLRKATSPPGPLSETERGSKRVIVHGFHSLAPLSASERGRG